MSQALNPIDYIAPGAGDGRQPASQRTRSTLAFVVVASLLILAAVALNVIVNQRKVIFQKQPVDTRLPLSVIKADLGPWAQVTIDRAQSADLEHELGTKQYVFRDYLDTRQLKPDERAALLKLSIEEREKFYVTRLRASAAPGGPVMPQTVKFAVTYYTGGADTVPHVPDRCFAADGFKPSTYDVVTWPILPRENGESRDTQVRLINFVDQIDSRKTRPRQVAYFFQVNGAYENDPVFGVRKRLASLLERRAYFAKIEIVTDLADATQAGGVMTDFLQHAMPEVERVLPDRSQFQTAKTE